MKIGLIIRTKYDKQYKEIDTKKGRITIEKAILNHLKKKYSQHKFITLNAHKLNVKLAKSCDIVWFCFEDFTNILKEQIHIKSDGSAKSLEHYNKTINSITEIPNIYPNKKFLKFIHDKCEYYKFLKNKNIPVAPTVCVNTKKPNAKKILETMKKWPRAIFKPVLGGETKGFQIYDPPYNKKTVTQYFKDAKEAQYPAIIIQRFMPNFATEKYPEIRTVWSGSKFQYAVLTTGWGEIIKLTKKIPAQLKVLSKKVLKLLEEEFKTKIVTCRIDFGKTPQDKIFINEIEYGYGTFADVNPKISKGLPESIAENFAKIHNL